MLAPLVASVVLVAHGLYAQYDWTPLQYVVATLLLADMVGGIATNATSTAKRWYFREGQGFLSHMGFVALHIIQISIASYFFLGLDLVWIAVAFGYLMVSCAVIQVAPLYLQRPIAMLFCAASMVLSIQVLKSPQHLEWFLPLFFIKLQVCHLLREEPYRPDTEDQVG